MARARYIKPTFFTNERVAELPPFQRLAWQGLWCQADRDGRLKDRPKTLKIEILPYDDVDFEGLLQGLVSERFIVRYEVAGERFIWLPSFLEHQKPHPKEPQSIIPAPPQSVVASFMNHASSKHDSDIDHTSGTLPGKDPLNGMNIKSESESESESEPAPAAPREIRHKPIDEQFLRDLQDEHPAVNVRAVLEKATNRKNWDGYKDKRRALRDHIGYEIERLRGGNTNGTRAGSNTRGNPGQPKSQAERLREILGDD